MKLNSVSVKVDRLVTSEVFDEIHMKTSFYKISGILSITDISRIAIEALLYIQDYFRLIETKEQKQ